MAVLLQARNTTAACFPLNLVTSNKGHEVQKQVGNEGEEQLSTLVLKLRKLLVWAVDADQFLFYPNQLLILHLHYYRPDFMLTPNFSLGFSDSRLDLLNNACTTHARTRTDLHRHRPT